MVVLVAVVSFLGSCIGLWLTGRVLDALPLAASFPDTPIHGLTYAELAAATVTSLLFAYCVGLMNGSLFGRRHVVLITVAATIPPFAMLMGLAAVTLGVGLIASPMVAAYGVAVIGGVRRASRYRLPSA